jgi:PPIC-type PPIASE domain
VERFDEKTMQLLHIVAVALICSSALGQNNVDGVASSHQPEIPNQQNEMQQRTALTPKPASPPTISPNTAVVTLEGVCDHSRKRVKSGACRTVITRAQMDALIDDLVPGASPEIRGQFAINYARILAAAEVASRQDLDKAPAVAREIQTRENLARLQVLASRLYKSVEVQALAVPQAEVLRYYTAHAASYEEGDLQRLTLPKSAMTISGKPLDEAEVKAKASAFRTRAAAGESFEKLQDEAYKALEISGGPPSTKLSGIRRSTLTREQAVVFDLQPGGTSEVVEGEGSFLILKLDSKKMIPLDRVQGEIESSLKQERLEDGIRRATTNIKAEFNLNYLGTTSAPELFPLPGQSVAASRGVSSARSHSRHSLVRAIPAQPR